MGTDNEGRGAYSDGQYSDSDSVGYSGPLSGSLSGPLSGPLNKRGGKKSARFNLPDSTSGTRDDDAYVEITLDVRDDSVAVHSVKPAGSNEKEDPEVTLLAKTLEKRSSLGSSVIRSASNRIRQVSQELRRLASITNRAHVGPLDKSKSAATHALKGLKFITKTDGAAGWPAVEKRFDDLAKDGKLPRALFGQCIGWACYPATLIN